MVKIQCSTTPKKQSTDTITLTLVKKTAQRPYIL